MTDERKRAIIERAVEDRELLAHVPAVVAFGFGVLPVHRKGTTLTLACRAVAARGALRLLRVVLDADVVLVPFEDELLQPAIGRAYPAGEGPPVNFPTFASASFLEDPRAPGLLRESKVEAIGETGSRLDPALAALASLTYHGRLIDCDQGGTGGALPDPRRTKYELGDGPLAWTLDGDHPVLWADGEGALYLNEFRFSDHRNLAPGLLYAEHATRGTALPGDALPFVIHPTEVQLVRLEPDGALAFHAYDREEVVRPGAARAFSCRYHFLSMGQRLRREIDVTVHEVLVAPRARLARRTGSPPWSGRELARWLHLDGAP